MPLSQKIALVRCEDSGLLEGLRKLPAKPAVHEFASLYDCFEPMRELQPDLLFLSADHSEEADLGALRLLRSAIPGLVTVLLLRHEQEVECADFVERAEARALVTPFTQQALAAVVSMAGSEHGQLTPDTFLDITRGISDEVNNPLMFASGHLQLLAASLDPSTDADRQNQVEAIRGGLDRIAATVAKMHLLNRAGSLKLPLSAVPLRPLIEQVVQTIPSGGLRAFYPDELNDLEVSADGQLLTAALEHFCVVGAAIGDVCREVSLVITASEDGVQIRLQMQSEALQDWQLPMTFAPYYLNRMLRGTTHGLNLFVVQTVVHAHGGQAIARRRLDGTLLLDLLLPRACAAIHGEATLSREIPQLPPAGAPGDVPEISKETKSQSPTGPAN